MVDQQTYLEERKKPRSTKEEGPLTPQMVLFNPTCFTVVHRRPRV